MQGQIASLDEENGVGVIFGNDARRYRFRIAAVDSFSRPQVGDPVEFDVVNDDEAVSVSLRSTGAASASRPIGNFDLSRVISRTFTSIGRNWQVFLVTSILLVGLPSFVFALGQYMGAESGNVAGFGVMMLGLAVVLVFSYVLQGLVMKAAIDGFNEKSTSVGDAFSVGFRTFLPLFGLSIVMSLGIGLGILFLVVPGLILTVLWSVASPAIVVERRGVLESLQRSRDLTRGFRWHIFGLLVIYMILSWILGALVGGVSLGLGGAVGQTSGILIANMVATPLTNILSSVLAAAGVASLYYELRSAKEGTGAEELAAVFD